MNRRLTGRCLYSTVPYYVVEKTPYCADGYLELMFMSGMKTFFVRENVIMNLQEFRNIRTLAELNREKAISRKNRRLRSVK